jgi:peptidoglycan hydrolase-like protein with peptidoglycan-binding domain
MPGKSLVASVGYGGANAAADVMTVQFLLNCVPVSQGGPMKDLAVDGIVGPKTMQAIQRFQKTQFGWSDGRIDPEKYGGTTIVELKKFAPVPDSPPIEPSPEPKFPSQPEGKGLLPRRAAGCRE